MNEIDLPVDDHMLTAVHAIRDNARLAAASRQLQELGISALPVQDASGRLVGVLEGTDLERASRFSGRDADGSPRWSVPDGFVAEWMRTVVPIVSRGQPLRECARRMVERGVRHLYVVSDRELCGLLGTREVMHAVAEAGIDAPLSDLVRPARAIAATVPASAAGAEWAAGMERPLVVLDGDAVVGVFGRSEMLAGLEANPADATDVWMDRALIELPASTPVHVAAQRALAARARYVVARAAASGDGPSVFHVVTGLAFAACIAGERASAIPPMPLTEPPLAGGPSLASPPPSSVLSEEERRPRPFFVATGDVGAARTSDDRDPARDRDPRAGSSGGSGAPGGGDPRTR